MNSASCLEMLSFPLQPPFPPPSHPSPLLYLSMWYLWDLGKGCAANGGANHKRERREERVAEMGQGIGSPRAACERCRYHVTPPPPPRASPMQTHESHIPFPPSLAHADAAVGPGEGVRCRHAVRPHRRDCERRLERHQRHRGVTAAGDGELRHHLPHLGRARAAQPPHLPAAAGGGIFLLQIFRGRRGNLQIFGRSSEIPIAWGSRAARPQQQQQGRAPWDACSSSWRRRQPSSSRRQGQDQPRQWLHV